MDLFGQSISKNFRLGETILHYINLFVLFYRTPNMTSTSENIGLKLYFRGDQLFIEKGHFWKEKKLEGHVCRAKRGVFEGAKRPRTKRGVRGSSPGKFL